MQRMSPVIRTPDQRLRIFVSSTLKELAPERKSARTAIERLHLAPVMFELGARPHPPRELYRAYLEQSHVFVGLYWESYGWVAPAEDVSGLEDEYNLSGRLPKLIYIKDPAPARDERLTALLNRVKGDDLASFKSFETAKELAELLEADLATLLAESFEQSRAPAPPGQPLVLADHDAGAFPAPLTELIGREAEVAAVRELLVRDPVRLVTLTGPGGIGKSRVAIDVGRQLETEFGSDVVFVDLAPVQDAGLVVGAIASALGVRDTGDGPLVDKLTTALRSRKALLVLDNFEQVLDAAPHLTELLADAPGLKFLVTSRTLLRVTGENNYEVGPLGLPTLRRRPAVDEVLRSAAIELFVERARAVKPDFDLTEDNVEAVAKICQALDGVPLALELAAARIRTLTPALMLDRLERRLPLLAGGARDLPARQRTLRNTIDWSCQLLGENERHLLAMLGVFVGGFSLEAVEAVCGEIADTDVLAGLGTLVDNSLVRQQDRGQASYFTMLGTVREYAMEMLDALALLAAMRKRHADYYYELGARAQHQLDGPGQLAWVFQLAGDGDNLRATERFFLDERDWSRAARFAWNLYIFWWVGGHLGEVRGWMEEVLAAGEGVPNLARAEALYFTRAITFWQDPDERVVPGLTESAELFHRERQFSGEAVALVSLALALLAASTPDPERADAVLESSLGLFRDAGDRWGEAMALVTLGRVALLQQKVHEALNRFEESLSLTELQQDELGATIALHHRGWADVLLGNVDKAQEAFEECLAISSRLGHDEGVAYGLEGLVATAAAGGDVERAGRLLGAAESLREQTGLHNAPTFTFHQWAVDRLLAGGGVAEFETARAEGRAMSLEEAIAYALPAMSVRRPSAR